MAHLTEYQKVIFKLLEEEKFDTFRIFTRVIPSDNESIHKLVQDQIKSLNEDSETICLPYSEMEALKRLKEYFDLISILTRDNIIEFVEDPKEPIKEKIKHAIVLNDDKKTSSENLKVIEYIKNKENIYSIIIAVPEKLRQYRKHGYKTPEESYNFLSYIIPYIITTLLTLITIFFTCKQSEIANLQTKIAKQSVLPLFIIESNPAGNKTGAEELIVRNDGATIFEFKCEKLVRMDIDIKNRYSKDKVKYSYYLNDYFDESKNPETGRGILYTSFAHQNEITYKNLKNGFDSLCISKGIFGEIKLHRYIYLSYKDQLGELHNDYYHIPEGYGSSKIQDSYVKELFQDAKENDTTIKTVYLHKLKPDDLINKEK